ncbi:MAG TPA: cupin domain-containing protein [bacterium]|nr:cupin domain-containing protein [bacterium]HPP87386.1 cupin domain-containing protein [bacterium]
MKVQKLQDKFKGWFIGDFENAIVRDKNFEIAVKYDKAGDTVKKHFHKFCDEITVVVKGNILINGQKFSEGDIILIEKNEAADYVSIDDSITVIVKIPSIPDDKHYTSE